MKSFKYKIVSLYAFFDFKENLMLKLKDRLSKIAEKSDFSGLLIISKEGINGTLCADEKIIEIFLNLLKKYVDFSKTNIKVSYSKNKIFKKLKIKIKEEIVTMRVPKISPSTEKGEYVESINWNKLIEDENTLIIDTRNHYEVSIGTFQNSINPNTKNFSEFPKWVDDNLEKRLGNKHLKNIAMFCTGGIRCEKATSLLKKKGFKNIFHLKGGILKYFEDISKEESKFKGECFVFDKRVALDHELKKGSYDICHACGMPISLEDKNKEEYVEGVQCHLCIDIFSDDDRKRFQERQKQIIKFREKKS